MGKIICPRKGKQMIKKIKHQSLIAFLIPFIIMVILILGLVVKHKINQLKFQNEMVKIVKRNKHIIEDEVSSSDRYHKIKKIIIDYESVEHNPMGGIMFEGYVNDDKSLEFGGGLNKYSDSIGIESDGIDYSEKLSNFLKSK